MCGIAGFLAKRPDVPVAESLTAMLRALYGRGPDSTGLSLYEAVRRSIDDLDGSFTYLVSTAEGFGVARDRFSTKPCLVAETDDWIAVVSEGIALAGAFGDEREIHTYELRGGEALAWTK